MRIYIAGKISGLVRKDYLAKFERAETMLRAAGFEPVNPCKIGIPEDATTHEALPKCLAEMGDCKAIYMLSDWKESVGAIVEHATARHLQMDRYYEEYHSIENMIFLKRKIV